MSIVVSEENVKSVCKIGCGAETCRYLSFGQTGFNCEKHTGLRKLINRMVKSGEMNAKGDNCEGLKP